eukprot:1179795-Prorocentrum_minimum.AAC.8
MPFGPRVFLKGYLLAKHPGEGALLLRPQGVLLEVGGLLARLVLLVGGEREGKRLLRVVIVLHQAPAVLRRGGGGEGAGGVRGQVRGGAVHQAGHVHPHAHATGGGVLLHLLQLLLHHKLRRPPLQRLLELPGLLHVLAGLHLVADGDKLQLGHAGGALRAVRAATGIALHAAPLGQRRGQRQPLRKPRELLKGGLGARERDALPLRGGGPLRALLGAAEGHPARQHRRRRTALARRNLHLQRLPAV